MNKEAKTKKPKSKARKIFEGIGLGVFVALVGFVSVVLITSTIQKKQSSNPLEPTRIGDIYLPLVVSTDSMEPVYPVKSAIFIKKQTPQKIIEDFNNLTTKDVENNVGVDLTFDDFYQDEAESLLSLEELAYLTTYKGIAKERTTLLSPMHTMTHRLFMYHVCEDKAEGEGRYLFFVEGINRNSSVAGAENQYQVFTEKQLYGRVTGCSKFLGWIFDKVTSPWGLVILLLIPSLYMVISSIIDVIKAYKDDDEPVTEIGQTTQKIKSDNPLEGLSEKEKERLKKEMLNDLLSGKDKK